MRNGRFNTSNCRSKLQRMGVLYTHSPKGPSPFSKLPIIFFYKKKGHSLTGRGSPPQLIGDQGWVP